MGCDCNFTSLVPGSIIGEGQNGCKNPKNRTSAAKLSIKDGKTAPKFFLSIQFPNQDPKNDIDGWHSTRIGEISQNSIPR